VYHTSFEDNRNAYYIFEFQILSQFMLNWNLYYPTISVSIIVNY
jgi:hypothetical protein